MKKFSAFTLALVLAVALCACGRRQDDAPTNNTTEPTTTEPATMPPVTTEPATTAPTIIPDMPELDTNVPDPTVDSNSTDDSMDATTDSARGRNRIK